MLVGDFTYTIQPLYYFGKLLLAHIILAEFYKLEGI